MTSFNKSNKSCAVSNDRGKFLQLLHLRDAAGVFLVTGA